MDGVPGCRAGVCRYAEPLQLLCKTQIRRGITAEATVRSCKARSGYRLRMRRSSCSAMRAPGRPGVSLLTIGHNSGRTATDARTLREILGGYREPNGLRSIAE